MDMVAAPPEKQVTEFRLADRPGKIELTMADHDRIGRLIPGMVEKNPALIQAVYISMQRGENWLR